MGKHMAASLLRAGHHLTICDSRPAARDEEVLAGAEWAPSPGAASAGADFVVASLPGPVQVDEVVLGVDGVLSGIPKGGVFIDMSTSTPTSIRAIAQRAAEQGVGVVDAPVAGGMRGARKATLTIMVGAEDDVFNRSVDVLRAMGTTVIHVGPVGAGHIAKLVNNIMTIVNGITAMEAIVLGVKAGVDAAKLIEVAQAGTGDSYSLNVFPYVIFKRNFDPAKFALSLAAKDLRISAEYAETLGLDLTVVPHVAAAMAAAVDAGLGQRDWTSYITLLEQQAGIEVR